MSKLNKFYFKISTRNIQSRLQLTATPTYVIKYFVERKAKTIVGSRKEIDNYIWQQAVKNAITECAMRARNRLH